jgi:hypothetical protein
MFGFGEGKAMAEGEETKKSSAWGGKIAEALADARKGHSSDGVADEKGTKKSGKKDSGGGLSAKAQEQIAKLFEPASWRPIVKAPFAFFQAMTGRDCWELSKNEEDTLATSTSAAMEYVAVTDPKWLAIGMCTVTWTIIFSEKLILSAREAKKEALSNPQPDIHPKTNLQSH